MSDLVVIRARGAVERGGKRYYLGHDVEIINVYFAPGEAEVDYHGHETLTEICYVIIGELTVWLADGTVDRFSGGDVVSFAPGGVHHRAGNTHNMGCVLLCVKVVTDGVDYAPVFETDKVPVAPVHVEEVPRVWFGREGRERTR